MEKTTRSDPQGESGSNKKLRTDPAGDEPDVTPTAVPIVIGAAPPTVAPGLPIATSAAAPTVQVTDVPSTQPVTPPAQTKAPITKGESKVSKMVRASGENSTLLTPAFVVLDGQPLPPIKTCDTVPPQSILMIRDNAKVSSFLRQYPCDEIMVKNFVQDAQLLLADISLTASTATTTSSNVIVFAHLLAIYEHFDRQVRLFERPASYMKQSGGTIMTTLQEPNTLFMSDLWTTHPDNITLDLATLLRNLRERQATPMQVSSPMSTTGSGTIRTGGYFVNQIDAALLEYGFRAVFTRTANPANFAAGMSSLDYVAFQHLGNHNTDGIYVVPSLVDGDFFSRLAYGSLQFRSMIAKANKDAMDALITVPVASIAGLVTAATQGASTTYLGSITDEFNTLSSVVIGDTLAAYWKVVANAKLFMLSPEHGPTLTHKLVPTLNTLIAFTFTPRTLFSSAGLIYSINYIAHSLAILVGNPAVVPSKSPAVQAIRYALGMTAGQVWTADVATPLGLDAGNLSTANPLTGLRNRASSMEAKHLLGVSICNWFLNDFLGNFHRSPAAWFNTVGTSPWAIRTLTNWDSAKVRSIYDQSCWNHSRGSRFSYPPENQADQAATADPIIGALKTIISLFSTEVMSKVVATVYSTQGQAVTAYTNLINKDFTSHMSSIIKYLRGTKTVIDSLPLTSCVHPTYTGGMGWTSARLNGVDVTTSDSGKDLDARWASANLVTIDMAAFGTALMSLSSNYAPVINYQALPARIVSQWRFMTCFAKLCASYMGAQDFAVTSAVYGAANLSIKTECAKVACIAADVPEITMQCALSVFNSPLLNINYAMPMGKVSLPEFVVDGAEGLDYLHLYARLPSVLRDDFSMRQFYGLCDGFVYNPITGFTLTTDCRITYATTLNVKRKATKAEITYPKLPDHHYYLKLVEPGKVADQGDVDREWAISPIPPVGEEFNENLDAMIKIDQVAYLYIKEAEARILMRNIAAFKYLMTTFKSRSVCTVVLSPTTHSLSALDVKVTPFNFSAFEPIESGGNCLTHVNTFYVPFDEGQAVTALPYPPVATSIFEGVVVIGKFRNTVEDYDPKYTDKPSTQLINALTSRIRGLYIKALLSKWTASPEIFQL